jgi:hypothetical protein
MRGLCAATQLRRVRELIGGDGVVGLSRFSEGQSVFSPEILEPVLRELVEQSAARPVISQRFGRRLNAQAVRVVDSTIWKVLPRMNWAQWRPHYGKDQRALRLHVKLRLADLQPVSATVTEAKRCERAVLRRNLVAGEFYLGDRYYGEDYAFFDELVKRGCGFVLRLRNDAFIKRLQDHALSAEALAQGVKWDSQVQLGLKRRAGPWRVVCFQRAAMREEAWVVCSEQLADLSAVEIMELYRHRWEVEMFFRWLKCLVPCRHWLAQSRPGVSIQIYLALIEALLLAELSGRKPNRRMMELCRWHAMGWAEQSELTQGLLKELNKQGSKNSPTAA